MTPANPYWIALLIGPAFLISTALSLPTFSAFERSMPVTVSQLLWARILASLGPVWIALLLGILLMLSAQEPLSKAREPVECAAYFTACVCTATLARPCLPSHDRADLGAASVGLGRPGVAVPDTRGCGDLNRGHSRFRLPAAASYPGYERHTLCQRPLGRIIRRTGRQIGRASCRERV